MRGGGSGTTSTEGFPLVSGRVKVILEVLLCTPRRRLRCLLLPVERRCMEVEGFTLCTALQFCDFLSPMSNISTASPVWRGGKSVKGTCTCNFFTTCSEHDLITGRRGGGGG